MNFSVIYTAWKLAYYVVLILYHGLDFAMDWYSFYFLLAEGRMSGVPVASIAVKILFGFSCISCTICTAVLLRVYAHYIKYHFLWLYVAAFGDYGPVDFVEGNASIQLSDDSRGDREKVSLVTDPRSTVDPKYIMAELVISVAELTLKDDIQSGLLFWVSKVYVFTRSLSWHALIFSICSLVAHMKLFICFVTKLFRLGEDAGDRSRWDIKYFYCVLGCIGSATFEGLTIAYLVKALQP